MHDPDVPARQDLGSLAPVQLDSSNDDDDIAKLRRGQKFKLTLVVLCTAVAAIGGFRLLRTLDEHGAYAQAASELERIDAEQGGAFLRCALPNARRSQLASADGLRSAIESASERLDKGYANALGKCTPLFERFEQSTMQIKVPPDIAPRLAAVSNSVTAFGAAWNDYRAYLQKPADPGAEAPSAASHIEKISSTWQSYQNAREQARHSIVPRL
jgi:hypothetical protein